jgi:Ca2+-binding EF-hand superfamily protein
MESVVFNICILALVALTVVAKLPQEGVRIILGIFIAEVIIRIWAMGIRSYLLDSFCVLDLVLVLIEVVCRLLSSDTNVMAGRLAKFFKIFKFMRMLRGLRCFKSCFGMWFKSPEKKYPPAGTLSHWLHELDEGEKDGRFCFQEFHKILTTAHLTISETQLRGIFEEIYDKNEGFGEDILDDLTGYKNSETKTISIDEFEAYLSRLRPSTRGERFRGIASKCLQSWGFILVSSFSVRHTIKVLGKQFLGPFQAYDSANTPAALALMLSIQGILGQIGFLALVLKGGVAQFDAYEDAQRVIVEAFRGRKGYQKKKRPPVLAHLGRSVKAILPLQPTESPISGAPSKRKHSIHVLDQYNKLKETPDAVMDQEQLRALLQQNSVHISDVQLAKLFAKIDTSGDGMTSVRELGNFVDTWKPATKEERELHMMGTLFGVAGFLEVLYLVGFILFTGNSYFWEDSTSAQTRFQVSTLGLVLFFAGQIGIIMIRYEMLEHEHEALQGARHVLISAVSRERPQGGKFRGSSLIESMFQPKSATSSSKWIRRVLEHDIEQDCSITEEQLGRWCDRLDHHPQYRHVKYFSALLQYHTQHRHQVTQVDLSQHTETPGEVTGMPRAVVFRLRDAVVNARERPAQSQPVTLREFVQLLQKASIYMPLKNTEDVFNEIDRDRSGRITEAEFRDWLAAYRPLREKEKQRALVHALATTLGFYALCAPLIGCVLEFGPGNLWSSEGTDVLSLNTAGQLVTVLWAVGQIEVQRMACLSFALAFDKKESRQLELKAGVECATDIIALATNAAATGAATGMAAAARARQLVESLYAVLGAGSPCWEDDAAETEAKELAPFFLEEDPDFRTGLLSSLAGVGETGSSALSSLKRTVVDQVGGITLHRTHASVGKAAQLGGQLSSSLTGSVRHGTTSLVGAAVHGTRAAVHGTRAAVHGTSLVVGALSDMTGTVVSAGGHMAQGRSADVNAQEVARTQPDDLDVDDLLSCFES